jgi:hypothetical protein
MSDPAKRDAKVTRISGDLEDWLQDFVTEIRTEHKGKVRGICVHLDIQAGDEDFSFAKVFQHWDSRHHLQGVLMTTIQRLAEEIMDQ